jgi:hypothetical protein
MNAGDLNRYIGRNADEVEKELEGQGKVGKSEVRKLNFLSCRSIRLQNQSSKAWQIFNWLLRS